ncbi:MAG: hypothetical protein CMM28_09795 [Rhodospirillaceae bacterium]|nr:hypothetical protein [Rhodospirillaceae bacterium]
MTEISCQPNAKALPSQSRMLYRGIMDEKLIIGMLTALSILPVGAYTLRADAVNNRLYWLLLISSALVFSGFTLYRLQLGWQRGLADSLFVCVAVTLVLYTLANRWFRESWRLAVLLSPYLFIICLLALLAYESELQISGNDSIAVTLDGWTVVHIVSAVTAYATITLAAVAAVSVLVQERLLKAKKDSNWGRRLPPVADSENIELISLFVSEAVLAVGIVSGMALQLSSSGSILEVDHKTLLTVLAFLLVGLLLVARMRMGIRGRSAARYVLISYLLITLGYPGVKWVSNILIG